MAQHSTAAVRFELTALPIIAGMAVVDDALGANFKLRAGRSPETSGGLLVALPSAEAADAYVAELRAADGQPAWVVGRVVAAAPGAAGDAVIVDGAAVLEVGTAV